MRCAINESTLSNVLFNVCVSYFLKIIYFNWNLITLQYCGSFYYTSTWISHGCTCVLPCWTPPLTSITTPSLWVVLSIPLGCPRAPALSALLHASNLHWSSILHVVIYMFQRYSLISSHLCLLPHSSKVCSLHLCLFCCLAYRVIVTIFLNFIYIYIYALIYCIGVSLSGLLHSV